METACRKPAFCPRLKLNIEKSKKTSPKNPFLLVSQFALTERSERTVHLPDISRLRRSEPVLRNMLVHTRTCQKNQVSYEVQNSLQKFNSNRQKDDSEGHNWKKKAPMPIDTSDEAPGKQGENTVKSIESSKARSSHEPRGLADMFQQIKCANLLMQRLASMRRHAGDSENRFSPHASTPRKSPLRRSFRNTPKSAVTRIPATPTNPQAMAPAPQPDEGADAGDRRSARARRAKAPEPPPPACTKLRYLPGCGRVLVVHKAAASPLRQRFVASPGGGGDGGGGGGGAATVLKVLRPANAGGGPGMRRLRRSEPTFPSAQAPAGP